MRFLQSSPRPFEMIWILHRKKQTDPEVFIQGTTSITDRKEKRLSADTELQEVWTYSSLSDARCGRRLHRKWFALTGMRQHEGGEEGASSLLQDPESRSKFRPLNITRSGNQAITWRFPSVQPPPRQLLPSGSAWTCRWRRVSVSQSCLWSDSRRSGPLQSSQTPETTNRFRFDAGKQSNTDLRPQHQTEVNCSWIAP